MKHSIHTLQAESQFIRGLVNHGNIQEMTLLPLKQDFDLLVLMTDDSEDITSLMDLISFPEIHIKQFSRGFEPLFGWHRSDLQDIFAELNDTSTQLMVDMVKRF